MEAVNTQTTPSEGEQLEKKVKHRERGVKQYQFFILRLLVFLVIVWVLFFVFIGLTHMPNGDMYPRIDSGDFVMYYRLDKTPKFQDVIVYQKPDANGKKTQLISRVVAVPGDTVEVTTDGAVIVNGNPLIEPAIFYHGTTYEGDAAPVYPLTLGENEYFVLGDQRAEARDSRSFGPVKKDEILGLVVTIARRINL